MFSKKLAKLLGTSFGLGFIPGAPGTYGALLSLPILYFLAGNQSDFLHYNFIILFLVAVTYFVGVWACHQLNDEWGHDPSKIVIDETCGMLITMLAIDINLFNLFSGFVLFRFFDIVKPFGIRKIDQMTNSNHTVMLDDVLAGIYANVVLQAGLKIFDFVR